MQDTLKDLSDRQLMQTMQAGSSPQYLVLAEMQRRKKMREEGAQAEPQSDRSVADDIISGIAAVPTRPMEMAEGGIVSFAKGGKTGRMKGEEEACWTDASTGEKYCPPSTPQMEMPRTGQRKSFNEGGDVSSDYRAAARTMAEQYGVDPDLFERLIEQESGFDPNATSRVGARGLGQVMPNTASDPGYGVAPLENIDDSNENLRFAAEYYATMLDKFGGDERLALAAYNAGPGAVARAGGVPDYPETRAYVDAIAGQQPAPTPTRLAGGSGPMGMGPGGPMGVGGGSTFAPGRPGEYSMPEPTPKPEPQAAPSSTPAYTASGVPVPGHEGWLYNPEQDVFYNPEGRLQSPPVDPEGWEGTGTTIRRFRRDAAEEAGLAEEDVGTKPVIESSKRARAAAAPSGGANVNPFASGTTGTDDTDPTPTQPAGEDGLMELMRSLQEERQGLRESSRQDAINQALIRAGLSMAASDNPNFLGALGEGGLQGLAGFQSAMESAAERQGDISSEEVDLMVAREANDIRRQAADASRANAAVRARQGQINNLIDLYEAEQKALLENPAAVDEEKAAAQKRVSALKQQIDALMGISENSGGGASGPADRTNVTIDGE